MSRPPPPCRRSPPAARRPALIHPGSRRATSTVMSSNCGAPPAKASIAWNVRSISVAAGCTGARAQHVQQPLLAELLVVRVLRFGDAVREEHERVAALEDVRALSVGDAGRAAGRAACRSRRAARPRPSARSTRLSRWPAPTNVERAGGRHELGERRGDVLLRRRGCVEQLAGVASELGERRRAADAAPAASPACCS